MNRASSVSWAIALAWASGSAWAQLRVATWNVTNYDAGRVSEFQAAIYASFQGRSLAPDVLVVQEMLSATGVANFLAILNGAPGSPGDWAAGDFVNGPDTDSAFFYRTSKVVYVGHATVAIGGNSPNHPRNIERYDWRPVGYPSRVVSSYSTHMKSGTSSDDAARRLLEAQRIRVDAQAQAALGRSIMVMGDLNIRQSGEGAYQELVGSKPNNAGRFFDPISTPGVGSSGEWYQQFSMRFVHTQAPGGTDPGVTGGMDDRHDQILLGSASLDEEDLDYIGLDGTPYSATTWNDANHTYRAWGNDGSSYNIVLNAATNAMVGPTIAQALKDTAIGGGHLPVFLDMQVPARVGSPLLVDFGTVEQGSIAEAMVEILNDADTGLWSAGGIDELDYSLAASPGFAAPGGSFSDGAGGGANTHTIAMDTSSVGAMAGTLTIASDDPDEPLRAIDLVGEVVEAGCAPDCEDDADLDLFDFLCFQNLHALQDPYADWEGDGDWDFFDFLAYQNSFAGGCP